MQPGTILMVVMMLAPTTGHLMGLLYSGLFLENFHTFFAAPYMHAGSIGLLAFGLATFLLLETPRLLLPPATGSFRRVILLFMVLSILSLLNGLIHSWPIIGVVADFVYMAMAVFVYFVGRFALESMRAVDRDDARLTRIWIACSAYFAIVGASSIPLGSTIFLVGSSGVLAIIISLVYSLSYRSKIPTLVILATPLVLSLGQMNRTTLAIIILTFFVITAAGGAIRVAFRILFTIGVLAVALLFVHESVMDSLSLADTPLARRMTELLEVAANPDDSDEVALSHRMFEAKLVLTELSKKHPVHWVVGAGAGATLDMTQGRDDSVITNSYLGGEQVHNVHLFPAAVLYRYGLLGLAVYGYFGLLSLRFLLQAIRRARAEGTAGMELIASTYIVISLAEGMSASGHFLTDWLPYFLAAYLDHVRLLREAAPPEIETPAHRTPDSRAVLSGPK
jgi:hypothetical protein